MTSRTSKHMRFLRNQKQLLIRGPENLGEPYRIIFIPPGEGDQSMTAEGETLEAAIDDAINRSRPENPPADPDVLQPYMGRELGDREPWLGEDGAIDVDLLFRYATLPDPLTAEWQLHARARANDDIRNIQVKSEQWGAAAEHNFAMETQEPNTPWTDIQRILAFQVDPAHLPENIEQ